MPLFRAYTRKGYIGAYASMSAAESENLSTGKNTFPSLAGGGEMADDGQAAGGANPNEQEEQEEHTEEEQAPEDYSLAGIAARVFDQVIRPREDDSPMRGNTPDNEATAASAPQPSASGGPIHLDSLPERPKKSAIIVAAVNAAEAANAAKAAEAEEVATTENSPTAQETATAQHTPTAGDIDSLRSEFEAFGSQTQAALLRIGDEMHRDNRLSFADALIRDALTHPNNGFTGASGAAYASNNDAASVADDDAAHASNNDAVSTPGRDTATAGIASSTPSGHGPSLTSGSAVASASSSTTTNTKENAAPNDTQQLPVDEGVRSDSIASVAGDGKGKGKAPLRDLPATPQSAPGSDAPDTIEEKKDPVMQVEYYFSDENLLQDAHLLSRTGSDGLGWVSLNEILGFKKMRAFKLPKSQVKAALKLSKVLETSDNDKFIRRKTPLPRDPTVPVRLDPKKERDAKLAEQPWMTKGMTKPTGFETANISQGPLDLNEYEAERRHYDPDEAFTSRIDRAVCFFMARRKFHEKSNKIFGKYLAFGGFSGGNGMFTGGINEAELEDHDKDDIALMKAKWGVSEQVLGGVEPDEGEPSWVVDFEGMTKAFLSSEFMLSFDWMKKEVVFDTTNILRNFFNYLVVHDVCPEYKDDIDKAVAATHLADKEFSKLAKVDSGLPGDFNMACSTLYGGYYAQYRPADTDAEWVADEDKSIGLSMQQAAQIFTIGINAHCTDEQLELLDAAKRGKHQLQVSEEDIGLKVVSVEYATDKAKEYYHADKFKGRFQPTGVLHCTRWSVPRSRPKDLPKHAMEAEKAKKGEVYDFVMEDSVLEHFVPGMRIEAIVKKLDFGLAWIDAVEYVYPTFFKYTLNEQAHKWKEPGPPRNWRSRKEEQEAGDEADEDEDDDGGVQVEAKADVKDEAKAEAKAETAD